MSIVHVVGTGGVSVGERTLFVGPRTPPEIKQMIKPLKQIDKTTFRRLLHVNVACLEGKSVPKTALISLETSALSEESIAFIYAGIHKLLICALRIPQALLKQETFKEDLKELNIPAELIPDIASVVYGSRRNDLDKAAVSNQPHLPKLERFRWRVDVAISTSVLNRVLQPTIFMEMATTDGKLHKFEVPVAQFHALRYSVASVLKEMEEVEKRGILKIQA